MSYASKPQSPQYVADRPSPVSAATDARLVDQVLEGFEEAQNRIGNVICRVRDLADGLTGEESVGAATAAPSPTPTGRLPRAINSVHIMHEQLSYLDRQIDRLSRL